MNKITICLPLTMVLLLLSIVVNAQEKHHSNITLDGFYEGTFADVIDQIAREHGVKFIFNRER